MVCVVAKNDMLNIPTFKFDELQINSHYNKALQMFSHTFLQKKKLI